MSVRLQGCSDSNSFRNRAYSPFRCLSSKGRMSPGCDGGSLPAEGEQRAYHNRTVRTIVDIESVAQQWVSKLVHTL